MIKIDENQDKDVTYENEPESQRQLFPNIPLTVDVSPLQDAIDALDERMDDAESDIDSIMTTLQTFDGQPGVAETVSDMTDTNKIYIYVGSETGYTSGDWYYYDGTAWVSGGAYVANPVQIDDTLTQSGEAADAKVTGDEIAQIKSDLSAIEECEMDGIRRVDKWVNGTYSGMTLNDTNTRIRPDYWVFVKAGDTVTVNNGTHYVHAGVVRKGTISSSTVVRSDSAWVTTNETITIADDGFLMFSFADAENKSLVLNPADFDGATDVTSYAKRNVDALTSTIKNGIGDACTYNISLGSTSSIGNYWNTYIDYPVKIGDVITFTFNEYSGIKLTDCLLRGIRNDDTNKNLATGIKEGNTISVVVQENYKQLWVQLVRSEAENSVTASFFIATDASGGIVGHVLDTEKHVYHVEKDGSGDFTNLATAIEYAEQFMDSTVYVGAGTWNILDELGSDYVQSVSSSKRGIVLKNRIHLIFSSEALVTCIYEGINGVIKDDTVSWLSAFNAGEYGFTLENCRIQSRNVRYSVHDEMGLTNNTPYINRYINCQMTHNNQKYDQNQGTHGYAQCIGGGLGTDGYIEITGCVFENSYQYSADTQGRKVLVS